MESYRPIKPFDMNVEDIHLATEWARWKRQLEFYFRACAIDNQSEKCAKLLHLGGADLQDLYENLPDAKKVPMVLSDPPYYDAAISAFDAHFEPKRMVAYERYVFRQMAQKPSERISDFVLRLRVQAKRCNFSPDNFEEMIIDQIAEKCNSDALRMEILKRDTRSLDEIILIGITMADSKEKSMEMAKNVSSTRNDLSAYYVRSHASKAKSKYSWRPPAMNRGVVMSCFACGRAGHLKSSKFCPARDQKCNKCFVKGHFAKCCFRFNVNEEMGFSNSRKRTLSDKNNSTDNEIRPTKSIRAVSGNSDEIREDGNIFFAMGRNVFHFKIGGIEVPMTIDSGADANIISLEMWEKMKAAQVEVHHSTESVDRVLRAYASEKALNVTGMFTAEIQAGPNKVNAEFYVVEGGSQCLLGEKTASELRVLKIGFDVAAIESSGTFPKMRGILLEIPIDTSVQPIQQPYRRPPIALESLIEQKLKYLLEQDVIEKVTQPSPWVSPLVPVLKDSGEIRLCVDMRRANRAVLREKHPLPVIDELLGSIHGAVLFSKLDIKDAYHQIEISEKSREITTFITKFGMFR